MRGRTTEDCCGMFAVLARTRPSHLSGLDPKLGVKRSKGTSKGNCYHRERGRDTCKHINLCAFSHIIQAPVEDICVSINIHPRLICFINTECYVDLKLGEDRLPFYGLFPKQITEKEFLFQDVWIQVLSIR